MIIDDEAVAGTVAAGAHPALDVVAKDAAAETVGDVVWAGGVGDVGSLGEGFVEEWNVHTQRAEAETLGFAGCVGGGGRCGGFGDAPSAERPEEDADVLDVVAALLGGHDGGDAADVDFVGGAIEAGVDVDAASSAHVGCVVVVEADVVHVLGVGEDAEEFHGVGSPGGGIAGQLLHHQDRALAAAERDGVGDFGARAVDRWGDAAYGLVADEVADVGDDPGGAGLDELVVVELVEVFGDDG